MQANTREPEQTGFFHGIKEFFKSFGNNAGSNPIVPMVIMAGIYGPLIALAGIALMGLGMAYVGMAGLMADAGFSPFAAPLVAGGLTLVTTFHFIGANKRIGEKISSFFHKLNPFKKENAAATAATPAPETAPVLTKDMTAKTGFAKAQEQKPAAEIPPAIPAAPPPPKP